MKLLSAGRIGCLVYDSRFGPLALTFEYKMCEGSVVSPPTGPPSPRRTCVLVSRMPSTGSPWRSTRSIPRHARDGWSWSRRPCGLPVALCSGAALI